MNATTGCLSGSSTRPGALRRYTRCFKDSADEAVTIIKVGIGRGCSLVVNKH